MKSPALRAAFAASLLSLPVTAQFKTVVPASAATTEGNTFDIRPFGLERVRTTQLIPLAALGITRGRQITEVAYRRDGSVLRTRSLVRRRTRNWSLRLGNIDTTVTAGRQFDPANPTGRYIGPGSGRNSLIEYYNAIPNWPTLPPVVGSTAPFSIRFKLRSPFTVQGPRAIAVDHYLYGANAAQTQYYIDAVRSDVDRGTVTNFGKSCPTHDVHNRSYAVASNPGGDPAEFGIFGAAPNAPALLVLGASRTLWGTIPLPLGLEALGLKGCSILVSQDVNLATRMLSTGSARVRVQIPASAALAGVTTYAQWTVLDTQLSNIIPLTFSDAVEMTTGRTVGSAGLATSMLYGANLATVVRGRVGLIERNYSFVTEFTHN